MPPWRSLALFFASVLLQFTFASPLREPRSNQASTLVDSCINLGSFIETYLDQSAKIRTQETQKQCRAGSGPKSKRQSDDFSCDQNRPCSNHACCGKNGFCGYGPDYCGTTKTSPNDKCWSNCDATAECGQYAATANATCPLSVCCSQYGFCGTTDEFCGTGCQSNCGIPTSSGKTGGDVQSRIIGYYEGWNYNSGCTAVSIQSIPVGSLTHLNLAFGYITPSTWQITMMPGVPNDVITQISALKSQNPGIKLMMSLGGWSFNDNGTDTQQVYPQMTSTLGNRLAFIGNLLAFLTEYGFDGVDFDWEYPGAGDRGGGPNDGANFESLLFDLRVVNLLLPKPYIVSFTTPTSYWYLQHFDLGPSVALADFTNLMAYDLHGTWDSPADQIGSIVLAHTNLTEIKLALSLFWRNGVDPAKVNLGIGFYGRSFQLQDPGCWQPGCAFKGGAAPGPCTQTSGILSYNEITNIINQNNLEPYWDKENAVKYMTWDNDQWVSYDDQDTFQQKIQYANSQGLGGLLIWAVDLDTPTLDAMQGLVYPKTLNAFENGDVNGAYWQDASQGICRLTDCGATCVPGEILITTQPCGGNSWFATGVSQLCCPIAAAPDPKQCRWRGNPPYCNGHCQPDEVPMEQNKWGDSNSYCSDGNYVYCCSASSSPKATGCRTTGCGGKCNSNEISMAGKFYDDCWFEPKQLCCQNPNGFSNCYWQGKGGSCFDNNCKFGTEIQLAESWDGGGSDCGIQLSRQRRLIPGYRVFCCTPPNGGSPFLPVPLEYLFPNPPTGNTVGTNYKLSVDDTYGGKYPQIASGQEPEDAAFGFFVMTSPQAIQVSLDKRDGSHWDLFDCFDSVTEGEHTIRMTCIDDSPDSNCHLIGLGKGVPGTILEMPDGCGPGRYAVAKHMTPSMNQTLPGHIATRMHTVDPLVYDLTFDYDFTRVPRDMGPTQIRLDYSNQKGYWDAVVDKAASKKRKRSLEDFGGNHRRWLEHAWKEDLHEHGKGLVSREELHERWFGSSIVAWFQEIFGVAKVPIPLADHSISETLTVLLLQEKFQCTYSGVNVQANLDIKADASVTIDTSFGLTIITTLGVLPDLSSSYLYFRNRGKVAASFNIDALAQASYTTGDIELFGLQNFGATFSVPGIITVGPNFRIFGNVNMDVSLSGHFQADVTLADWDTQVTFPDQGADYDPQNLANINAATGNEGIKPTIDWTVSAKGQITAHVKPTVSFGISWGPAFQLPNCEVDLVADGYLTAYVSATAGAGTGSKLCYGVNTGTSLSVKLDAPSQFNWILPQNPWSLASWGPVGIIPETCPIQTRDLGIDGPAIPSRISPPANLTHSSLSEKRGNIVIGPLLRLPFGLTCPSASGQVSGDVTECPLCTSDITNSKRDLLVRDEGDFCVVLEKSDEPTCPDGVSKRFEFDSVDIGNLSSLTLEARGSMLEKRAWQEKTFPWFGYLLSTDIYPTCGTAAGLAPISKWFGFNSPANTACLPTIHQFTTAQITTSQDYVTEHVFEPQNLKDFMAWLVQGDPRPFAANYQSRATVQWVSEVLLGIPITATTPNGAGPNTGPYNLVSANLKNTAPLFVWNHMCSRLGDVGNQRELVLADRSMNRKKEDVFALHNPNPDGGSWLGTSRKIRDYAGVFTYLNYNPGAAGEAIWNKYMRPANYIDLILREFDNTYVWGSRPGEPQGLPGANGAPNSPPRMRWLWKTYMDMLLGTIDAHAVTWCANADTVWTNNYANAANPALLAWQNAAFTANTGFCTANGGARLPRPNTGGLYGVYGNAAMTFNWAGAAMALGAPTP
ncbi:hypothetical protein GQ53DRAFT_853840 [Thozetella sp. PMI_491]|nr:hypothetical protein GQ53DRAFT_853840 [Thozetella sp. PMI_491]